MAQAGKLEPGPLPRSGRPLAFDRAASTLLPMGKVIRETSPEHQQAIVRHIVERVVIQDGVVVGIDTRPEARPFFEGMAVAPPDGLGGSESKPSDPLAWYALG